MMITDSSRIEPIQGTLVRIKDKGNVIELDYDGAMTEHQSSLWWGTAVGYRAMQAAAVALSDRGLWSRDDLYVVSAHPGPGVADAINYVTRAVERDRYLCVKDRDCQMKCNSSMKYEWWVSDGERTVEVKLRSGFVPVAFYELADRLGVPETTPTDKRAFDIFKVNLSSKVWVASLADSFQVTVSAEPLRVGELPEPTKADGYWDSIRAMKKPEQRAEG